MRLLRSLLVGTIAVLAGCLALDRAGTVTIGQAELQRLGTTPAGVAVTSRGVEVSLAPIAR